MLSLYPMLFRTTILDMSGPLLLAYSFLLFSGQPTRGMMFRRMQEDIFSIHTAVYFPLPGPGPEASRRLVSRWPGLQTPGDPKSSESGLQARKTGLQTPSLGPWASGLGLKNLPVSEPGS